MKDLTEAQFRKAATRNGFDIMPTGTHLYDPELKIGYGMLFSFRGNKVKVHFRESLARAIQMREKDGRKSKKDDKS